MLTRHFLSYPEWTQMNPVNKMSHKTWQCAPDVAHGNQPAFVEHTPSTSCGGSSRGGGEERQLKRTRLGKVGEGHRKQTDNVG